MWPTLVITETLSIPVYPLILSLVSCACILWIDRRATSPLALGLTFLIFVSGFLGARLFHVFYEEPRYYLANPWQVFAVWQGGFVWFGGLLSAVGATALWCRWKRESFLKWADFLAPVIAFGYGFGRLACFFNGCCYGRSCNFPWGSMRHPTQLYMFAYEVAVGLWLLRREKRATAGTGALFFAWLGLHGVGRFVIEFFRDDARGPMIGPLSVSMAISLMLIAASLGFFYKAYRSRK